MKHPERYFLASQREFETFSVTPETWKGDTSKNQRWYQITGHDQLAVEGFGLDQTQWLNIQYIDEEIRNIDYRNLYANRETQVKHKCLNDSEG